MDYHVPQNTKTFFCNDCKHEVNVLRWKEISKSLNKGSAYKCDDCWEKFDKQFDNFCMSKVKKNIE